MTGTEPGSTTDAEPGPTGSAGSTMDAEPGSTGGQGAPAARWRASRTFARSASSVATVRAWLREVLRRKVGSEVLDTAELLISELATNAVLYGAGEQIMVRLTVDGELEASVHDQDVTRSPRLGDPAPGDARGRGLVLVHGLATSWGTRVAGSGKWVWFRLPVQAPAGGDERPA